jgi:hypothetical protein
VIFANSPCIPAVTAATGTIPITFMTGEDPVRRDIGFETSGRAEVRIDESSDLVGMRNQLVQKCEPLRCHFAR